MRVPVGSQTIRELLVCYQLVSCFTMVSSRTIILDTRDTHWTSTKLSQLCLCPLVKPQALVLGKDIVSQSLSGRLLVAVFLVTSSFRRSR